MKTVVLCVFLGLAGCAHFVEVTTEGSAPVFNWRTDAPVTGLMILADEDCALPGNAKGLGDRIWWQVQGKLTPPVKFGVVPPGATELAHARPFLAGCHWWSVTLTDQSMQGELTKFRW